MRWHSIRCRILQVVNSLELDPERYPGKTPAQLETQMRKCGAQVPDTWKLLPHFVNGMLDVQDPKALLIEGNEATYYTKHSDLYLRADANRGEYSGSSRDARGRNSK